jgi:hypothetical protein
MSKPEPAAASRPQETTAAPLKDAVREARIEAAERTGVVVDLRDAELARLEILNEALDPVFAAVPGDVDLFDRGVVPGASPRLWIDMLAHVSMGRDKRVYRFLQDTRYGRRVLVESAETGPIVEAVTRYVARRLVERERALVADTLGTSPNLVAAPLPRRWSRWKGLALFALGMLAGVAVLFTIAWFVEPLI